MKTRSGFKIINIFVMALFLLGTVLNGTMPAMAEPAALPAAEPLEAPGAQGGAPTTFAVVSDYGYDNDSTVKTIANMVNSWNPEFIVTAGDNNQGSSCNDDCYKGRVGAYYGPQAEDDGRTDFMTPGNFYPLPGNHDYSSGGTTLLGNYKGYFTSILTLPPAGAYPGAQFNYYDFRRGPVHFFMMDSGPGTSGDPPTPETQQAWLQNALGASSAPWKIVMFHIPAVSGGTHKSSSVMQWNYKAWGADFVISGHNHIFEHNQWQGLDYFTTGTAGNNPYSSYSSSNLPTGTTVEKYFTGTAANGAMKVTASETEITFDFYSRNNEAEPGYSYTKTQGGSSDPECGIVSVEVSADTYFSRSSTSAQDQNYGATKYVRFYNKNDGGHRGGLLRFDLSEVVIPEGAEITEASLGLYVSKAGSGLAFNMYALKQAWVEGIKDAAAPGPEGGATWETYDGTQKWGDGGANSTETDRFDDNLWTAVEDSFATTGKKTILLNDLGKAVVQSWLDQPLDNHGFLIKNYDTDPDRENIDIQIASKENTGNYDVPTLNITYCTITPPPAESSIIKAVDKEAAAAGETLTYTINGIGYDGAQLLTNVSVTDAIPAGTTYVTDSANLGATLEGDVLTWLLGSNTPGVPGEVIVGGGTSVVAIDGARSQEGITSSSTTLEFNHTTGSGENRLLVVGISFGKLSGPTIQSVKFGDEDLIQAGTTVERKDKAHSAIYYLVDPPHNTTKDIVITTDESTYIAAGAINFMGVDQNAPIGAFESAVGITSSSSAPEATVTVTTSPGDLVFDTITRSGTTSTQTPGSGQTEYWQQNTSSSGVRGMASSKLATTTSTEMEWTFSSGSNYAYAAVPIQPSGGSTHTTTLSAGNTLVSAGDTVTVEVTFANTAANTNIVPGTLQVVGTGDADCTDVSAAELKSTDNNISGVGDPVVYQWTCKAVAGTSLPSSLTFSVTGEGADGTDYALGTSNSVLVAPELSFQVTIDALAEGEITNIAVLDDVGTFIDEKASEPAVTQITEAEETPITSAALTVTAPEAGATPASTATVVTDPASAATVKSVSWDPGDSPFGYSTAYTVTVVLEAEADFEFTDATTAKVNDEDATVESWSASTLTVTFQFPATEAKMHTVTFYANDGTGTMTPQTASTSTALTPNAFERTGYTFAGWNTKADGSGTAYDDEATYDFTADLELYAQWTINTYTLAVTVSGEGTVSLDKEWPTYPHGEIVTLNANPNDGYVFMGWSGDLTGAANPATLTMDENKEVFAAFSSSTVPPYTSSFYGEIQYVEGDNVPAVGSLVEAYIDDVPDPTTTNTFIEDETDKHVYRINVGSYSDGTYPEKVTFKINGRIVAIAEWEYMEHIELHLHPPKADAGGPYVALKDAGSIPLAGSVADRGDAIASTVWALDGDGVYNDAEDVLNPTFAFSATGAYPVSLMAVDAQGGQGFGDSLVFVITVDGLTGQVYDGDEKSVSVSELTGYDIVVLYNGSTAAPTNAGSYRVTIQIKKAGVTLATYDAGYMVIGKAEAQIMLGNLTHTYDKTEKSAAVTTVPSGLSVDLVYDPLTRINAGSYGVTATVNDINYMGSATGTLIISKREITVTAVTDSKVYDGTPTSSKAPEITSGSLATGDTPSFTQTFDDKKVGTGKTLTPAGTIDDGNEGKNYTITPASVNTGVITAKPITVTAVTDTKVYDGTATSSKTPEITSGSLADGDEATWSQAFDDKNAGTRTLTPSGSISDGNSGNNYTITFTSVTGTITAKPITVTAVADSKDYDGTASSDEQPTVDGSLIDGDTATWSQAFDDKHAGTGKTLTPTGTISDGNSGNNYAVTYATVNTGEIAKRAITVTAEDKSKMVGESDPDLTYTSDPALATGDAFEGALTREVGEDPGDYDITIGSLKINDGKNGANYDLDFEKGTFTITGATIEIDLVAGWNLVSIPVKPLNTEIEDVLESIEGKYTLVYAWDATGGSSGAGHWMRYAPVGYDPTLTTLDESQGFWIFMTEDATLEVTGNIPATTNIALTTTVGGWNLVGYPSSLTPTPPALMGEINYKLIMTYLAADTADPWKLYDPAAPTYANDLVEMLPGYGYWIFVNQDATLEVPF